LTLVHIIENTVPWNKIRTEIRAGDLLYRDDETDGRLFVPISDSLLALDELLPEDSSASGSGAPPAPSSGDTSPVSPSLVERSELGYIAMFLDVSLARAHLEAAATRIRAGDTTGAGEALLAVQTEGLVFEAEEVELPLEEAAANLKLAEHNVAEGQIDFAAKDLAAASEALQAYELGEGRHAEEARQMHKEIEALVESLGDLTGSASGRGEVEEKIANWWKGIAGWLGPKG
jgi:hypothetical protein